MEKKLQYNNKFFSLLGYFITGSFILAPSMVLAANPATTTFQVKTTVLKACTVAATTMDFSNYDPLSNTPLDITNSVNITCTKNTSYTVALNAGTTSGGTCAQRRLAESGEGADTMKYNIYTDNTHTSIWGDGTGGSITQTGSGSGTSQTLTGYGRIPAGQYCEPNNYTDTVTITVTY